MHDQPRQPRAALLLVGGLVGRQPGAARRVAVPDMDGSASRSAVGDLLPAPGAVPAQRGKPAAAGGQRVQGVLGGAGQQRRPGLGAFPAGQADHPGDVLIAPDAARGGDGIPPAAARPGRRGQPDQLLIRHHGSAAEVSGELGQRLVHSRQPRPGRPDRAGLPATRHQICKVLTCRRAARSRVCLTATG